MSPWRLDFETSSCSFVGTTIRVRSSSLKLFPTVLPPIRGECCPSFEIASLDDDESSYDPRFCSTSVLFTSWIVAMVTTDPGRRRLAVAASAANDDVGVVVTKAFVPRDISDGLISVLSFVMDRAVQRTSRNRSLPFLLLYYLLYDQTSYDRGTISRADGHSRCDNSR